MNQRVQEKEMKMTFKIPYSLITCFLVQFVTEISG